MATKTGIEWADSTWSPIRVRVKADAAAIARSKGYTSLVEIAEKMQGRVGQHCEHISPGCENCYAETNNERCLPHNGTGLPYDRRSRDLVTAFVDDKVLSQPPSWGLVQEHGDLCEQVAECRKAAGHRRPKCGCPTRTRRIFVENQSDLFAEWVTDEMLDLVFGVMAMCPHHVFQVLTKRPERALKYFTELRKLAGLENDFPKSTRIAVGLMGLGMLSEWMAVGRKFDRHVGDLVLSAQPGREGEIAGWPLPNVWLGVSVENQAAADERIPLLLKTPAAVRFISAEPLLGPLDLYNGDPDPRLGGHAAEKTFIGDWWEPSDDPHGPSRHGVDWVICGGESGPGARPMHPDWARSLRDQCAAAAVAFFFKQWGEWEVSTGGGSIAPGELWISPSGSTAYPSSHALNGPGDVYCMRRVGKHAAGSLLDGVEHKAFPGTAAVAPAMEEPCGK